MSPIRYAIRAHSPEAHLFEVSCTLGDPHPQGQVFALPAWIPGSYMIREFARQIVRIEARSAGRAVPVRKLDKHTWRAAPVPTPLTVTIRVYAFDTSVRGAYLDTARGFFNGPCVFLRPVERENRPCELDVVAPAGARYRRWRVATALASAGAARLGFGRYAASNYDELIDSPVEMGEFTFATFHAQGVAHDVAIAGRHDADIARLARDLKRVCEAQMKLFGAPPALRPGRDRYVFLVNALGEGYGGLEHRASTALLCSRDELPRRGERTVTEGYRTFLGLVSHEYFHTWNVKRIKPVAFTPYDLDRENYTELLWAFEGITSYYDDLALVRAGLISPEEYLGLLARSISGVLRTPGRHRQSIAESSFDAWIKYYRPDENTPNAVVSYYAKGSLVALCLDMLIRARTAGRRSLDDVMRLAWRRYGARGIGVPEDGIEALAGEVAGTSLGAFFRSTVHGTGELPLAKALATVGVGVALRSAHPAADDRGGYLRAAPAGRVRERRASFGWRLGGNAEVRLVNVYNGGAAEAAGLAAGDVIVAAGGLRASAKQLNALAARMRPGESITVHAFRRDEFLATELVARAAAADTCDLYFAKPSPATERERRRWLGHPVSPRRPRTAAAR